MPAKPAPTVRALSWQYLQAAWRPKVGAEAWDRLAREAGAPDLHRVHPFENLPLAPFARMLEALDKEHGRGDGTLLHDIGRASVAAWAKSYRSLARELRGQPGKMLEVACAEVQPWFLDDPGASKLVDLGPTGALVALPSPLPEAFQAGMLEGFVEAAGVRGARVAKQGELFAVTWEAAQAQPSRLALLARATRLPFLSATLVPVLVGGALAWRDGYLDPLLLALTGLGVACFHLATNVANDWFDHRSRADEANLTPTPFSGGSRVIQRGLLKPRDMALLAAALYLLGAGTGLLLALHLQATRGFGVAQMLGFGVAGFLLGLLYSAPPVRLAHRGLGELAVALGFGPLIVAGTYVVQSIQAGAGPYLNPLALLFSIPVGALIAAVLYVNEFPDRPWDAQVGKRTLVVRLGERRAVWGYVALLGLAYGGVAAAAIAAQAWFALLALLTLPLAARAFTTLRRHRGLPYRMLPANATTLMLHLTTGLLLFSGIVLGRGGA